MVAKTEFDILEKRKSEIETRDKARSMHMLRLMSVFFTVQFAVSYHTIFNVEWLGWDLVEPFTYSISQGTAIMGMFYILKKRDGGVEYSELDESM